MTFKLSPYPMKCKVYFDKLDFDGLGGLTQDYGDFIRVDLETSTYKEYVVHEAVHVVQMLQKELSADFDDETEAYMTQYVVDKIMKGKENEL